LVGTYSLDKAAFQSQAVRYQGSNGEGPARYTVISRRIPADLETPVSALLKIRRGSHSFLLESVERGSQVGRYSFLGTEPHLTLRVQDGLSWIDDAAGLHSSKPMSCPDPLDTLGQLLAARRLVVPEGASWTRFMGGAVGYAGYETVCTLEPVDPAPNDPYGLPDLAFGLYDTFVVFDHVQRTAHVATLARLDADPDTEYEGALARIEEIVHRLRQPLPAAAGSNGGVLPRAQGKGAATSSNLSQAEFESIVMTAKEHITAGDIIQVVLSQRFERATAADPFSVYRALRTVNPSPYMFFVQFGDTYLVGASPEMLVQVQNGKITTHPIAGTLPRGADREEDERFAKQLLADEKERAEHLMLVDLARNDVGRIARIGSVRVQRFMEVERYSHVMHLVSELEGDLRPELGPLDVLRACFPAGTLSGAPKVRAMQIIAELERDRRGPYGGAAGYIGYDGNMDTAIVLRTLLIRNGIAHIQAGAGIVADSVPAKEYLETLAKTRAMLSALDLAEELDGEQIIVDPTAEGARA
jgi:anthranilate synthase component 1